MNIYALKHRLITDEDLGENPQLLPMNTKWEQGTLASFINHPSNGYWNPPSKTDIRLDNRDNRISTLFIPIEQYTTYTITFNKYSDKVNSFMVILTENRNFESGVVYSTNKWINSSKVTLDTNSANYASISVSLNSSGDVSCFGKDFNFAINKEHVISNMQNQINILKNQINKITEKIEK